MLLGNGGGVPSKGARDVQQPSRLATCHARGLVSRSVPGGPLIYLGFSFSGGGLGMFLGLGAMMGFGFAGLPLGTITGSALGFWTDNDALHAAQVYAAFTLQLTGPPKMHRLRKFMYKQYS